MDMSYLSCQKNKTIKDDSFIIPLGEMSHKETIRPISHEKKAHLGNSCVTMKYLMVAFYEKLNLVMLYVNNAPGQAVNQ